MEIKIGDKIAYIKYDVSNYMSNQSVGWGYVFYVGDDKVGCSRHNYSPLYINNNSVTEKYFLLDSDIKKQMIDIITNEIENLRLNIKSLTTNEKDEIIKIEFNKIKQQIITTAKNMINSDESDFINRVKSICELKKKLFTIKVSDLDNIHKSNGAIKYKIKKLNDLLEKINEIQFE